MSDTDVPEIIVFQTHLDDFSVLGNENVLTESSYFDGFWTDFFGMGGYEPILPFATDPLPVNVWYTNREGQRVYLQGLIVGTVDTVPNGYRLVTFPASDFLVVTTDWLESNEDAVGESGNGRCNRYAETVEAPEGYVRNDGPGGPMTKMELENADTPSGSRYEVWVPIVRGQL